MHSCCAPLRLLSPLIPLTSFRSASALTTTARFTCPSPTAHTRTQPYNNRTFHTSPTLYAAMANPSPSQIAQNCRKIVCIGRNYADHISELKSARPARPFFFLKPTTSILLPNAGPCVRPKGVDLSHEIELGIVIGSEDSLSKPSYPPKQYKNVKNDKSAMDLVAGYLLTIDMTARNIQWEAKKKGLPWSINKGFDTFLPISSFIPKDKIPDPHNCTVWLSVNDEMKQKDSTELFLFDVPRMLSDISKVMTLEDGDIVITGTPKGVGSIVPGDVVKGGIQVDGKDVEEANLECTIEDDKDPEGFEFSET